MLTPTETGAAMLSVAAIVLLLLADITATIHADRIPPAGRRTLRRHRRGGGHWPTKAGAWSDADLAALRPSWRTRSRSKRDNARGRFVGVAPVESGDRT